MEIPNTRCIGDCVRQMNNEQLGEFIASIIADELSKCFKSVGFDYNPTDEDTQKSAQVIKEFLDTPSTV